MTFETSVHEFTKDFVDSSKLNKRIDVFFGRGSPPATQEDFARLPSTFLDFLLAELKEKGYLLKFYSFELETGKFVFEYTQQNL